MQHHRIIDWSGKRPKLAEGVFIADGAVIIGDVEIGAGSSVWFNSVIRGDVHYIRIGERTNIQDGSVLHVTGGVHPVIIGDDVLVGHMALLHGCTVETGAMIGMRATVMDRVVVETGAMVAAGALVTPGKRVRGGELWAGQPAKPVRALSETETRFMREGPAHYAELAKTYM